MHIRDDKSLINVLNAAVTSNHQQVKGQLNDLIAKVSLIKTNDIPVEDIVSDLIDQIKDIECKLNDVTDYIKVMKISMDET